MALTNCKECNKEISTHAKACPHCGYIMSTNSNGLTWLIGWAIIILIVLYYFGPMVNRPNENITPLSSNSPQTVAAPTTAITEPQGSPDKPNTWEYNNRTDNTSGKEYKTASVISNNTVNLNSPYDGGTYARLIIRNHPRYGKDIFVVVNEGQLHCSYGDCYISLRFDDGNVIKNYVTEADDRSRQSFFLGKYKTTLAAIKKSKTMYIELTFFQQGSQTFELNTENLDLNNI